MGREEKYVWRKRMIDVCCLYDVRWRGQVFEILEIEGRKYRLWWSGNGVGGVGGAV